MIAKDPFNPTIFHKWLSYPRGILAGVFILVSIFLFGIWMIVSTVLFHSARHQDQILYSWAVLVKYMFNIELTVDGVHNLDDQGVLFLFNHTSHFDIPIFYMAVRRRARFGAKIELFKIPVFASVMRIMGTLPIARGEREKVLQLYKDSIDRVALGESFILAGEGTRQPLAGVGGNFKSGPFIFAIGGQFPIQPLVFKGGNEILPKNKLFPGWGRWINPVHVSILPAVPTKGLTLEDRDNLKVAVRDSMEKAYRALDNQG